MSLIFSRLDIEVFINSHNSHFADLFFKYITYLGHGALLGILLIFTVFKSKKFFYITIFSSILTFIFVRLLKLFVFAERPITYFKYSCPTDYGFHFVEGVKIASYRSFPSGHTATAFLLFFLMSVFFAKQKPFLQIIFFVLAFIVGYSRLYLFQHFLLDVGTGAFIAIFSVILSIFFVNKFLKNTEENGFIKIS